MSSYVCKYDYILTHFILLAPTFPQKIGNHYLKINLIFTYNTVKKCGSSNEGEGYLVATFWLNNTPNCISKPLSSLLTKCLPVQVVDGLPT